MTKRVIEVDAVVWEALQQKVGNMEKVVKDLINQMEMFKNRSQTSPEGKIPVVKHQLCPILMCKHPLIIIGDKSGYTPLRSDVKCNICHKLIDLNIKFGHCQYEPVEGGFFVHLECCSQK